MTTIYQNYSKINLRLFDLGIDDPKINQNIILCIQTWTKSHIEEKKSEIEKSKSGKSSEWGLPADITGKPDYEQKDPNKWVPLVVPNGLFKYEDGKPLIDINYPGTYYVQKYDEGEFGDITAFSVAPNSDLYNLDDQILKTWDSGIRDEIDNLINVTENLTEQQKTIAEFLTFSDKTTLPINGFWIIIAMTLSQKYGQTIERDIYMYFFLSAGLLDSCVTYNYYKNKFYTSRPIHFIRHFLKNRPIMNWYKSTSNGAKWVPYQRLDYVSPPSPDVVNENSIISTVSASILEWWFNSGNFNDSYITVTIPNPQIISPCLSIQNKTLSIGEFIFSVASSKIQTGIPNQTVVLKYNNLTALKDDCCQAPLYSGISISNSINIGKQLGDGIFKKLHYYFENLLQIKSPY
jgi:hypothetical protein